MKFFDKDNIKKLFEFSDDEKTIIRKTMTRISSVSFGLIVLVVLYLYAYDFADYLKSVLTGSIIISLVFSVLYTSSEVKRHRKEVAYEMEVQMFMEKKQEEEERIAKERKIEADRIAEHDRLEAKRIAEEKRIEAEKLAEAKRIEAKRIAEEKRIRQERLEELRRIEAEKTARQLELEKVNKAVSGFEKIFSALESSHYSNRFFSNLYELQEVIQILSEYKKEYVPEDVSETASNLIYDYEKNIKPYIEKRVFQFIEDQIKRKIYAGYINTVFMDQIVSGFERNDAFLSESNRSVIYQLRQLVDSSKEYDVEKISKVYIFAIDGIFDDMPDKHLHIVEPNALEKVDNMAGLEFEQWCADLLIHNGFSNVKVTKASHDQGVDILASKDDIRYAIQCKCYSSDLDNTPVQEIVAGREIYHCQIGVVMTNRKFTAGAIDAARSTGVLLWDRDKLLEMMNSITPGVSIS